MTRKSLLFGYMLIVAAGAFGMLGCSSKSEHDAGGAPTAGPELPESCVPLDSEEACWAYQSVLACCFPEESSGEVDKTTLCTSSMYNLYYSGGDAPPQCSDLMLTAMECAIDLAGMSCEELAAFREGLGTGVSNSGVGPPTDETMPCYEEVLATWNAGCEPYLF